MTQHEITRSIGDFDHSLLFNKRHERGCDVEVIFNKQRMPLHSVVLGGNSRYFEVNLFSTPIVPKVITLEKSNAKAAKAIIEYCYSGKMKLNQNDTINILEVAHILMVQPVIDGCCKILESTLDSKDCFTIWRLSKKLRLSSLKKSAFNCIRTTFKGITDDFLTINLNQLIQILQSNIFNCAREKYLTLIKEWINFDPEVRKENLVNLLQHVQLEELPLEILASKSKTMCVDKKCVDLFMDAVLKQKNMGFFELNTESTVIVLGGSGTDECKIIETYDTRLNYWRNRKVNFDRVYFSCAYYDQNIFVLGGFTNIVECYDIKTWWKTSLAPMHQDRAWFPTVMVDEYIYAIGGYSYGPLSSAERYNVKTNQWTQLASMPTARYHHKTAVVDREIFVVGGYNTNGYLANNECYTISTGNWRSCKPMQEKRGGLAVAALHGLVYAAGGYGDLSSVERYDPKVDQWTFIEPLPSPRSHAVLVNVWDSLIISGGELKGNKINTVEQYDPLKNRWSYMAPLNKARQLHNMIVYHNTCWTKN